MTYYEARFVRNADGSATASIFRVSKGTATPRGSARVLSTRGLLGFEVVGTTLRLTLDGMQQLSVTNTILAGPGLVGISLGNGVSLDDFAVTIR